MPWWIHVDNDKDDVHRLLMTLPFARYYGVKIRQTPIVLKFYFKSDFDRVLDSLSNIQM
jgi:hypothetical protein